MTVTGLTPSRCGRKQFGRGRCSRGLSCGRRCQPWRSRPRPFSHRHSCGVNVRFFGSTCSANNLIGPFAMQTRSIAMRSLVFVSLVSTIAAFSGLAPRGLFTPKTISGANFRPVLRKSVGPMMFDTKIFKKETLKFSDAPDETYEDILRVRIPFGVFFFTWRCSKITSRAIMAGRSRQVCPGGKGI